MTNVILSPHRAVAVTGGRQLMDKLVVDVIERMIAGEVQRDNQGESGATIRMRVLRRCRSAGRA